MSDRITQSDLDRVIKRLNDISKCRYAPNDAYGYAQLALQCPNSSGISNMSLGNTKSELYYQITFLLDWLSAEKNKANRKKSCEHFDNFNSRDEFRDRGLIYEYNHKNDKKTYCCISCHKTKFDVISYHNNHLNKNGNGKLEVKK